MYSVFVNSALPLNKLRYSSSSGANLLQ